MSRTTYIVETSRSAGVSGHQEFTNLSKALAYVAAHVREGYMVRIFTNKA